MVGSFFQVDRRAIGVCSQAGMNAMIAYLVMACGTGADNRTTSWSVNAIEKYTGIGRPRAKVAVDVLVAKGLLQRKRGGSNPFYYIVPAHQIPKVKLARNAPAADPEWIWLPKTLVMGAAAEEPPIERLRRLGDTATLRLLIDLYDSQILASDGGIHWRKVRMEFNREKVGEAGRFSFWRFTQRHETVRWTGPFLPFHQGKLVDGGDAGSTAVWKSWNDLKSSGLLECVEHLIESDGEEAEIIHPCPTDQGTEAELALGRAVREHTSALAGPVTTAWIDNGDDIVAVNSGYPNVQMVGVYRLRYRPHTKATAAWFSKEKEWREWAARYSEFGVTTDRRRAAG